jgi:hypothetical protein
VTRTIQREGTPSGREGNTSLKDNASCWVEEAPADSAAILLATACMRACLLEPDSVVYVTRLNASPRVPLEVLDEATAAVEVDEAVDVVAPHAEAEAELEVEAEAVTGGGSTRCALVMSMPLSLSIMPVAQDARARTMTTAGRASSTPAPAAAVAETCGADAYVAEI